MKKQNQKQKIVKVKFLIHLKKPEHISWPDANIAYSRIMKHMSNNSDPWTAWLLQENLVETWHDFKNKEIIKTNITYKQTRKCPKCDSDMITRNGRYGPFGSCSKYPQCEYSDNQVSETHEEVEVETLSTRIIAGTVFIKACGGLQRAKLVLAAIEKMEGIE